MYKEMFVHLEPSNFRIEALLYIRQHDLDVQEGKVTFAMQGKVTCKRTTDFKPPQA